MISDAELADLKGDNLTAMPDTATILRNTPVSGPGGFTGDYTAVGTTPCRLTASVLSGGNEFTAAGELVSTVAYTLTMPAGTDVQPRDRILCQGTTFEVIAVKAAASWNLSDSCSMVEVGT